MESVKIDEFIAENTIGKANGKVCWDFNWVFNDPDFLTLSLDQRQHTGRLINEDRELYDDLKTEKMSHVETDWL